MEQQRKMEMERMRLKKAEIFALLEEQTRAFEAKQRLIQEKKRKEEEEKKKEEEKRREEEAKEREKIKRELDEYHYSMMFKRNWKEGKKKKI
jgi:hypothetical protein